MQEFLTQEYEELRTAAKRITGNSPLAEELLHFVIDQFLFNPRAEEIISSGGGRFYIVRMLMNQFRNTQSEFFKTYRLENKTVDYLEEEPIDETDTIKEDIKAKAKEILSTLSWYDQKLFEIFTEEEHTISSLARATGIPRTSVSLTINRVRKHIKKNL